MKDFSQALACYATAQKNLPFRRKIYALMHPTVTGGRLHIYIDNAIVYLVLLSVLMIILESVESLMHSFADVFHIVDYVAVTIFTLEYLARIYVAPEHPEYASRPHPRLSYMLSPMAIIDLLAILPFYLLPLIGHLVDIRFLRVFRLARLLKLTRYTYALKTMTRVLGREAPILGVAAFLMFLLVLFAASLGYLFEHEAQPDKFENIPQSIYWAVITLASVGYGDISPVTPFGRAMTIVLSILGMGLFALPAGLLSAAFSDQLRLEREKFKNMVDDALADGVLSDEEKEAIRRESKRLHLGVEDVDRMIHAIAKDKNITVDGYHGKDNPVAATVPAAETQSGGTATVLDFKHEAQHPEAAFARFAMLSHQIEWLYLSVDQAQLTEYVKKNMANSSVGQRILTAVQSQRP